MLAGQTNSEHPGRNEHKSENTSAPCQVQSPGVLWSTTPMRSPVVYVRCRVSVAEEGYGVAPESVKCRPSKHGLRLVPSNSSPRSQLMQVDNVLPKIRLLRPCFVCMYLYIDTLTYISTLRCLLSSYNASPHISTYLVSQYMCVYSHIQRLYIYIYTYILFVCLCVHKHTTACMYLLQERIRQNYPQCGREGDYMLFMDL